VGNYPDETSAKEEIGRYIESYNTRRPHQALMNFTPDYVHQINNKTTLFHELKTLKKAATRCREDTQVWTPLRSSIIGKMSRRFGRGSSQTAPFPY